MAFISKDLVNNSPLGPLESIAGNLEQASQAYVSAFGITRDSDWFVLKLQEELGELTQAWNRKTGRGKRSDKSEIELQHQLDDEIADVFGHVLLLAIHSETDLVAAVKRKWRFDMSATEKVED